MKKVLMSAALVAAGSPALAADWALAMDLSTDTYANGQWSANLLARPRI